MAMFILKYSPSSSVQKIIVFSDWPYVFSSWDIISKFQLLKKNVDSLCDKQSAPFEIVRHFLKLAHTILKVVRDTLKYFSFSNEMSLRLRLYYCKVIFDRLYIYILKWLHALTAYNTCQCICTSVQLICSIK